MEKILLLDTFVFLQIYTCIYTYFVHFFGTAHEIHRRQRTKAGSPEGRLWADVCLSREERRGAVAQQIGTAATGTCSTARQSMQS